MQRLCNTSSDVKQLHTNGLQHPMRYLRGAHGSQQPNECLHGADAQPRHNILCTEKAHTSRRRALRERGRDGSAGRVWGGGGAHIIVDKRRDRARVRIRNSSKGSNNRRRCKCKAAHRIRDKSAQNTSQDDARPDADAWETIRRCLRHHNFWSRHGLINTPPDHQTTHLSLAQENTHNDRS